MTTLPPSTDFNGAAIQEGQFKTALASMRTFVSDLLGANSADHENSPLRFTKNLAINGSMQIHQRGDQTRANGGEFGVDRYRYGASGSAVVDLTREGSDLGTYLQMAVRTADVTIARNAYYVFQHRINGATWRALGWGTSGAKTVTISFEVNVQTAGIHCFFARNGDQNRSYVAEYTIAATNTWERHSVTVPGDTAGSWDNGVGDRGVEFGWAVAVGTDKHGTNLTWEGANDMATANQVNGIASRGDKFRLRKVQIEVGSVATPWQEETYEEAYLACLPYFYRWNEDDDATHFGFPGYNTSTTEANFAVRYLMPMVKKPTVSFSGTTHFQIVQGVGGTRQSTRIATDHVHRDGHRIALTVSSGLTDGYGCALLTDSTTNRHIDYDAEI